MVAKPLLMKLLSCLHRRNLPSVTSGHFCVCVGPHPVLSQQSSCCFGKNSWFSYGRSCQPISSYGRELGAQPTLMTRWMDGLYSESNKGRHLFRGLKSNLHKTFQLTVKRLLCCVLFMLQLLKHVGNVGFNNIFEAHLPNPSPKPTRSSDM